MLVLSLLGLLAIASTAAAQTADMEIEGTGSVRSEQRRQVRNVEPRQVAQDTTERRFVRQTEQRRSVDATEARKKVREVERRRMGDATPRHRVR